jgi:hypothetical protein
MDSEKSPCFDKGRVQESICKGLSTPFPISAAIRTMPFQITLIITSQAVRSCKGGWLAWFKHISTKPQVHPTLVGEMNKELESTYWQGNLFSQWSFIPACVLLRQMLVLCEMDSEKRRRFANWRAKGSSTRGRTTGATLPIWFLVDPAVWQSFSLFMAKAVKWLAS